MHVYEHLVPLARRWRRASGAGAGADMPEKSAQLPGLRLAHTHMQPDSYLQVLPEHMTATEDGTEQVRRGRLSGTVSLS